MVYHVLLSLVQCRVAVCLCDNRIQASEGNIDIHWSVLMVSDSVGEWIIGQSDHHVVQRLHRCDVVHAFS